MLCRPHFKVGVAELNYKFPSDHPTPDNNLKYRIHFMNFPLAQMVHFSNFIPALHFIWVFFSGRYCEVSLPFRAGYSESLLTRAELARSVGSCVQGAQAFLLLWGWERPVSVPQHGQPSQGLCSLLGRTKGRKQGAEKSNPVRRRSAPSLCVRAQRAD